jgi:DNA-directed RNA polymerase specialized sigma24 family protein
VGYRLVRDCLESSEPQTAVPSPAGHSDELARSLHDLPSTQRDVLLLHAALIGTDDIARILDLTPASVREHLWAAVSALRDALGDPPPP